MLRVRGRWLMFGVQEDIVGCLRIDIFVKLGIS